MAITAKVNLAHKQQTAAGTDGETDLTFSADYADGRNKEWSRFTPSLELRMRVKNSVADKFTEGASYVLSFALDPEFKDAAKSADGQFCNGPVDDED